MLTHKGSGNNVKEEDKMPHWGAALPEVAFVLFSASLGIGIPGTIPITPSHSGFRLLAPDFFFIAK
jgi:hypothetical protein